jgi:hypothetical protein
VRIRRSDLDVFIARGTTANPEPETPVDDRSGEAWTTFGAALADASGSFDSPERAELTASLDVLAEARELADVLRAGPPRQEPS